MLKTAVVTLLNNAESAITQIHANELHTADLQRYLVLDVREDAEFSKGFLPGAISLPRSRMEMACVNCQPLLENQKPVLVYCKSGRRSLLAAYTLQQLGVQSPISMAGGITAWETEKKPIEQR